MLRYSVIQILRSFSGKELKLFDEFIQNPFHNKNLKVIEFFDLLKSYHPDFSSEHLSKESLFRSIMGNAVYEESYVRNLFSDLPEFRRALRLQRTNKKDQPAIVTAG